MANVTIIPQTNEINQIKLPGNNTSYYFEDNSARTALSNIPISLSNDYTSTQKVLELISPASGDTFQVAISKLHAGVAADELILQAGLNDLNKRSFDDTLKVINNNASSVIDDIDDGVYVIQYVTRTGSSENTTDTLDSLGILIQSGINQYLYKDGIISHRTKDNNTWGNWISNSGSGSGEANIIESITFNGVSVPVTNKIASIVSHLDKIPRVTGTVSSSVTIDPYKLYQFGTISQAMTISFDTTKEEANYVSEYMFRFTAGQNCSITLPNTVKYSNGQTPEFTAGNIYEYSITDNLCVVGEFY